MNGYKDISYNLKKQNVLILEKSAPQNNIQGSTQQKCRTEDGVGAFTLDKGHHAIREKMVFPWERCFDGNNPFFQFFLKKTNSQLETARNPQQFYKGNNTSCTGEGKQATPLRIIKNQSHSFEASLPLAVENQSANASKESIKLVEKNHPDSIQLMKCTEDKMGPKKRKHEDGEIDIFNSEECAAPRKNIRFKTEKELYMGNPHSEFILKSEDSNSHRYVTENSKELYINNIASDGDRKVGEKDKNRADIFGNHLTAKDKNKIKVPCPHCSKKVPAPGFTRHLAYCMRGSIRKSARRS